MTILDTNIILLDANNILQLGSPIIIPETVVDELDSKKSVIGELGYQAREFGRIIAKSTKISTGNIPDSTLVESIRQYKDTEIRIVSSSHYPAYDETSPNLINDRKIIHIATIYNNLYNTVTFMSNDVMCRIRAEAEGLTTREFKVVDNVDFRFTKELTVPPHLFSQLHRRPILQMDPDYQPENYNYLFKCSSTAQVKLATIDNGVIDRIGKESEKDLRRQDINPLNAEQLFLTKALLDPAIDIVVCEALSGSGKTAVAISNGIRLVRQGAYDGILYIRASVDDVDDAEAVGFLPGLQEKFAVYLHPLEDTLDFIVRQRNKASRLKGEDFEHKIESDITELKTKCNIEGITGLGTRGRTFTNLYVVIDEVQNQSEASLQKMLTRIGKNCKVVIIGSLRQIDNKYLTKYTSGLSTILNAAKSTYEDVRMHSVTLQKVVRSPLAEWAEHLFSK